MYYRNFIWMVLCVFLAGLASCTSPNGETAKVETETAKVETETTKVETETAKVETETKSEKIDEDSSEVIISIGDKKLTMKNLEWMQPNLDDSQIPRLANWWLENELIYDEAVKQGIDKDPKAKFLADLMAKKTFAQQLRSHVQDNVQISDEKLLAYYEENKELDQRLKRRPSISLSHVRTKTLEEAQTVLDRIKAGENINELARQLSISDDAKAGGVMKDAKDYTIRRRFNAELLDKIKAANEKELIGPIRINEEAYEVVSLDEKVESEILPFEEAKKQI